MDTNKIDLNKTELSALRRKATLKRYYEKNKEKIRARYLANAEVNKEKSRLAVHKYYEKNKRKIEEYNRLKQGKMPVNTAVKNKTEDIIDIEKRIAILNKKEKLFELNQKKEKLIEKFVTTYEDGSASFDDTCHTKDCENKMTIFGKFIIEKENKVFIPREGQSWLCKIHTEKLNKIETWLRDNNEEASAIVKRVIAGLKPTHKEFNFGKLVETWIKDSRKKYKSDWYKKNKKRP